MYPFHAPVERAPEGVQTRVHTLFACTLAPGLARLEAVALQATINYRQATNNGAWASMISHPLPSLPRLPRAVVDRGGNTTSTDCKVVDRRVLRLLVDGERPCTTLRAHCRSVSRAHACMSKGRGTAASHRRSRAACESLSERIPIGKSYDNGGSNGDGGMQQAARTRHTQQPRQPRW